VEDDLLTTGDVAARLRISMSSALRLMQSGAFPSIDVSLPGSSRSAWRVRVGDYDSWMRSRTQANGSPRGEL
jgi:predicted DNA-binding transcriptional regulator AlpA